MALLWCARRRSKRAVKARNAEEMLRILPLSAVRPCYLLVAIVDQGRKFEHGSVGKADGVRGPSC
jgi:hypothetical protein